MDYSKYSIHMDVAVIIQLAATIRTRQLENMVSVEVYGWGLDE